MEIIPVKLGSFMNTIIVHSMGFDEIYGKINLIYQLLSPSKDVACND